MDGFQVDHRDGRSRPCLECEEVIRSTVESFDMELKDDLDDYDVLYVSIPEDMF